MQHRFIGNANRQLKPLAESSIGIRAHCPLKGSCAIADRPFSETGRMQPYGPVRINTPKITNECHTHVFGHGW